MKFHATGSFSQAESKDFMTSAKLMPKSVKSDGWLDVWMTCDFVSFSTVFQSYQDNGQVIMKGCVQWHLVCGWKNFCFKQGSNPGPLDQQASVQPTELPGLLSKIRTA